MGQDDQRDERGTGGRGQLIALLRNAVFLMAAIGGACHTPNDGAVTGDGSNAASADSAARDGATGAAGKIVKTHLVDVLGAVEIVAGGADTCARTQGGEVWCWGDSAGAQPLRIGTPGAVARIGSVDPFCVELLSNMEWVCRRGGYGRGSWEHPFPPATVIRSLWSPEPPTLLAVNESGDLLRWSPPLSPEKAFETSPIHFGVLIKGPLQMVSPDGFCVSDGLSDISCICNWGYMIADPYEVPFSKCQSVRSIVTIPEFHGARALVAAHGKDLCAVLTDGGTACLHSAPTLFTPDGRQVDAAPDREPFVDTAKLAAIGRIVQFANSTRGMSEVVTCARTESGEVYCWGTNRYGILGITEERGTDVPTRIDVPRAVQVSLGDVHGCALSDEHRVFCWGDNRFGQCGFGGYPGHEPSLRAVREAGAYGAGGR